MFFQSYAHGTVGQDMAANVTGVRFFCEICKNSKEENARMYLNVKFQDDV